MKGYYYNMSVCIGLRAEKKIYAAVDGRASLWYNNKYYTTNHNSKKYVLHNNKLIVTFGMSHAVKKFQRYCQSHPEITDLDEIFDAG